MEPTVHVGSRVQLIRMGADPHPIVPGTKGTVELIDGAKTVHVKWDDGRTLGLVPQFDDFTVLS